MSSDPASLRPVSGSPRDIEAMLTSWLDEPSPEPLIVRTSGSTGEPKQVALSAAALRASAGATQARIGGGGQWLLALSPRHVAGLQVLVRSVMAGTRPVVMGSNADLVGAVKAMWGGRRYVAVVPTQLRRWLSEPSEATALAALDAVLVGGAAADQELLRAARDRDVKVVTTYGMTETCGGCVYDGVTLDGVAVALGTGGEIRIAGPVLFDAYVGRPDLTAAVLRDGWFHTPDVGRFDADGQLQVLGRADDVVISGGVNVPLPAVERRLRTMHGVLACAVVARPDPEWGAWIVAVVVPESGVSVPSAEDVRDFVAETLPREWAPREVVARDRLPLLQSGKIDRRALLGDIGARV